MSSMSEKPQAEKLKECIAVLKKLTVDLGIPYNSPEVLELKKRFDDYIHNGTCWSGTVSFAAYGRIANVKLPYSSNRTVEVTLKVLNA